MAFDQQFDWCTQIIAFDVRCRLRKSDIAIFVTMLTRCTLKVPVRNGACRCVRRLNVRRKQGRGKPVREEKHKQIYCQNNETGEEKKNTNRPSNVGMLFHQNGFYNYYYISIFIPEARV